MGLLTRLRATASKVEHDVLTDAHTVTGFALDTFHRTVTDLQYANERYQEVKADAAERIRHYESRIQEAHAAQQKNTKVTNKINEFLGDGDAG